MPLMLSLRSAILASSASGARNELSQSRTMPSSPPAASNLPSGSNATAWTVAPPLRSRRAIVRPRTDQMLQPRSPPICTSSSKLSEATDRTMPSPGVRVIRTRPSAASHTRTVPSAAPDVRSLLSLLKDSTCTVPSCADSVAIVGGRPASSFKVRSQMRMILS